MFCKILIILNIASVLECMDHKYFANDSKNQVDTEQEAIVKRDIEKQDRIYGGVNCPAEEFKTIVALCIFMPIYNSHICGGSLINKNWGLTAAHCCLNKTWPYYAVTGITSSADTKPVASKVSKWYVHKEFKLDKPFIGNDIALFLLEKPIEETEHIKYVKLPTKDMGDIQQFCSAGLIKGWGRMEGMKKPETIQDLQCVDVPINNFDCRDSSKDRLICFTTQNEKGSCLGDSGGPMMCKGIQIGLCSFGGTVIDPFTLQPIQCMPSKTQGYTRVDKYLGFINNIMETHTPRKGCSPNMNFMSISMWLLVFFNVFRQFLQMM